jgi:hypothetical protein
MSSKILGIPHPQFRGNFEKKFYTANVLVAVCTEEE